MPDRAIQDLKKGDVWPFEPIDHSKILLDFIDDELVFHFVIDCKGATKKQIEQYENGKLMLRTRWTDAQLSFSIETKSRHRVGNFILGHESDAIKERVQNTAKAITETSAKTAGWIFLILIDIDLVVGKRVLTIRPDDWISITRHLVNYDFLRSSFPLVPEVRKRQDGVYWRLLTIAKKGSGAMVYPQRKSSSEDEPV